MITVHETAHRPGLPRIPAAELHAGTAGAVAPAKPRSLIGLVAASLLLAGCLVYFLTCVSIGWRHAISDSHGFRQSQTALSVAAMLRGGPWLIYETPVLGPPWTIPFEFPLFQWIVAALVWSTGLALGPAGRTISVAFFLLTLWPAERLLAARRLSLPCRLVILALLVSSPFYIFWSRTVLIESTALFLATWSLACSLWAIRRPSPGRLAAMGAVSSLAAVVKITTFFPFLIASVAVVGYQVLRRGGPLGGSGWARRGLWVLACAGLPALAMAAWTSAADHAKSRSTLGKLTTSRALTTWNFGTREQRLSAETWERFAYWTEMPLGRQVPFAVAALGLIMARRRLVEVAGCLFLYLVAILTFTNLFYVHEYYYFAINIFVVTAAGMAIVAAFEAGPPLRDGAIGGLILLMGTMVYDYNRLYRPLQDRDDQGLSRMAAAIRDRTAPDDIVVTLGFDWSSEVPYYSERRAVALAGWAKPAQVRKSLKTLAPYRVGAVAILHPVEKPISREALLALLREQGFAPQTSPVDAPYELLLRADRPGATVAAARSETSAGRVITTE